ncbi:MAG: SGNH/GDSL hydrolase family protein [bacterium]|nr:SGNH/GDSL hydrolase family protein [bacterium]
MSNSKDETRTIVEQFIVPFFHLKKRFPLMPAEDFVSAEANMLGLKKEELNASRKNLEDHVKQAALELLKEDEITDLIDKLPFDGSETIIGLGDSYTEDAQGWFAIIQEVLELSVEGADFTFINAGISANTTTDVLRRLDRDVVLHEPDWVLINVGTYDAQRLNIAPNRTLIPLSETWENLNTIQDVLQEFVSNPLIWITPSKIVQELISTHPLHEFSIEPKDLDQVIEVVSGKNGIVIDPQGNRMGKETEAWNFLSDGLNHSLIGHINTAREILKGLVRDK